MNTKFNISIITLDEAREVPGSWDYHDYTHVLQFCDFNEVNGLSEEEIKEYAILSLQDQDPRSAAEIVLNVKLGKRLTIGQLKNLSFELRERNLWEEHQDISFHKELYQCAVLLNKVFPAKFPETVAARCVMEVSAGNELSKDLMAGMEETLLVRMLADGMPSSSILKRLFKDRLEKGPFGEAKYIIWLFEVFPIASGICRVKLYSSWHWLKSLNKFVQYESAAFPDKMPGQKTSRDPSALPARNIPRHTIANLRTKSNGKREPLGQ